MICLELFREGELDAVSRPLQGKWIMDRDTLLRAIEHGPVRVTMNDGSFYDIDGLRDVAVDSTTCYLMRRQTDGRYRAIWLALVCMTKVEQLQVAS